LKKVGKFLILSDSGQGHGLTLRLKTEGHEAQLKVFGSDYEGLGHDIVDCACEYLTGETVVADGVSFGHVLESFRDAGTRIFGGGVFADKLETDRLLSEEVFRNAGIKTPDSHRANDWDDAEKVAKKFAKLGGKVVLKPEGGLSGVVPSLVVDGEEEVKDAIDHFHHSAGNSEINITIQEYIKGVAVSTEGWFNGENWIPGMFNHTIEKKKFLNCDLGPSTGCTGNLVWAADDDDDIVTETLTKLTVTMRKHNYVGPIDVNCVVNEEGIYALEFTPRFGYDAFPTLLTCLCDFDFGAFIDDVARGDEPKVKLSPGYGAGIRIGIPPWPSDTEHGIPGIALRGFKEEDKKWFYPYEMQLVDGELRSSRGYGLLGVVNGHGGTPGEAFARAYEICSRLHAVDLQYRTDLYCACMKDFRDLRSIFDGYTGGWLGVDLDGTLAHHNGWTRSIGDPIPAMVSRVKRWIREGKEIRVFTARGSIEGEGDTGRYQQLCRIYDWINEHIGEALEVTHEKDPGMIRLYDDRVVEINKNEGTIA
jgi:phosphoribosylamine--glycine ligase